MTDLDARVGREAASGGGTPHSVRRRGGLPSGRAVVGGFLIAVAAVGTFGAYALVTAEPQTAYLVAAADIQQGAVVETSHLGRITMHLAEPIASTTYQRPDDVVGKVALAPIRAGQMLQQGMLAERVHDGFQEISLALPADRVFSGGNGLQVGERVDVLATYASGADGYTVEVAREALVLSVGGSGDDSLGSRGERTLTLGLTDEEEVMALTHALAAAEVAVVRVTGQPSGSDAPRVFRPSAGRS